MAKVKIQGNASGTGVLTITAPNTSTDRTITLPDATGTLLTADGDGSSLTGVGVAGISSSADGTAITIDASENVGIGVVPESTNIHSSYSSIDISRGGALAGHSAGNGMKILGNSYRTASGYAYKNTDKASLYANDDGMHQFQVAPSGSADAAITFSTKATIDSDGLKFNGDTASANALDDYEEGTWTMALTCGSGSVTQSNAAGNYTKIGRQVTLTGYADVASISSPSGLLTIGGIPFDNVSSGTGFYTAVAVQGSNWVSSVTDLYGSLSGNNLYIFGFSSGNQTAVADKLQVGSAININVSYFTAA